MVILSNVDANWWMLVRNWKIKRIYLRKNIQKEKTYSRFIQDIIRDKMFRRV